LNGAQLAALGPRYADFKALYGRTSGVALGVAIAYGIDVDAFRRPGADRRVEGELVLKVWTRRSRYRMLWCYVACDDGSLACFPLFRSANPEKDAPALAAMGAPAGSRVVAAFGDGDADLIVVDPG